MQIFLISTASAAAHMTGPQTAKNHLKTTLQFLSEMWVSFKFKFKNCFKLAFCVIFLGENTVFVMLLE